MPDNIVGIVATGLFINGLYDYLKASTYVNGQDLISHFSSVDPVIDINEQQAEQIIEAINSKNLKSEAKKKNREAFKEKFFNDNQVDQIVKSINQAYINNQTNITTQYNLKDGSRVINTERYIENYHEVKEKKS